MRNIKFRVCFGEEWQRASAPSDFSSRIPPLSANEERYNIFVCFLSVTNTGNGKRYGLEIWLSCIDSTCVDSPWLSKGCSFLGDCTAACRNLGSCAQRQQINNKIWIWFCSFSLRPGYTSVDACWSFLEILCRIEFYWQVVSCDAGVFAWPSKLPAFKGFRFCNIVI